MPDNRDDEPIAKLKRCISRGTEIEPSFWDLVAELRALTEGRKHTPSEVLIREGREER